MTYNTILGLDLSFTYVGYHPSLLRKKNPNPYFYTILKTLRIRQNAPIHVGQNFRSFTIPQLSLSVVLFSSLKYLHLYCARPYTCDIKLAMTA